MAIIQNAEESQVEKASAEHRRGSSDEHRMQKSTSKAANTERRRGSSGQHTQNAEEYNKTSKKAERGSEASKSGEGRTQNAEEDRAANIRRTQKSTIRQARRQNAEAKQVEVAKVEHRRGSAANVLSTEASGSGEHRTWKQVKP